MKAIVLLSGGLDSTLAVKLMADQGIEVIALNFHGPFCTCSHTGCKYVSKDLGCELKTIALDQEYLDMVCKPKHGYGKNLNPCIDCRIFIFSKAKDMMKKVGAAFIVTGEVLGQRPMSQHRQALNIIERESGLKGLILRPLSAKLLRPTIPEEKGWIDREKLLSISGRSRRPQLALVEKSEIKENFCSGGGCLLTVSSFTAKVKDLIDHDCLNLEEAKLLRVGRHFRLNDQLKLIVGRDEKENSVLEAWAKKDNPYFITEEIPGPLGLLKGNLNGNDSVSTAASIIAYYSDSKKSNPEVKIKFIQSALNISEVIPAIPLDAALIDRLRI